MALSSTNSLQDTFSSILYRSIPSKRSCFQVLCGVVFMVLLSQISIPFKPVPMTMQTFAVFSMGLFMGSRLAFYSLLTYLATASLGFPVFPGFAMDPFWIMDPTAGYCLSFPFAGYLIGKISEYGGGRSAGWNLTALLVGLSLIYLMGLSWLSFFVGWEASLAFGFYPFVLGCCLKALAAFSLKMGSHSFMARLF